MSSKGQNSGGLMSSAGLVRYFDSEDQNAIKINPKTIIALSFVFGTAILILNMVA